MDAIITGGGGLRDPLGNPRGNQGSTLEASPRQIEELSTVETLTAHDSMCGKPEATPSLVGRNDMLQRLYGEFGGVISGITVHPQMLGL